MFAVRVCRGCRRLAFLVVLAVVVQGVASSSAWAAQSYPGLVVGDSPLGYWRLGESDPAQFADSAPGNLHPGSKSNWGPTGSLLLRSQPGLPLWNDGAIRSVAAPSGFGYNPDGASVEVPQGNPKTLLPGGLVPFTLEAWVKPTAGGGTYAGGVIGSWGLPDGSVDVGEALIVDWPTRVPRFVRSAYSAGRTEISGTAALPTDRYSHLAATFDGITMRLFVDGKEVASAISTVGSLTLSAVWIGKLQFDFGVTEYAGFFFGSIDETAVYGYALSPAQVREHYQVGRGASQPPEQTKGVMCEPLGRGSLGQAPCGMVSDPVNTLTGAFTHAETDLSVPSTGVPFELTRTYSSAETASGRLGLGWTDTYQASLAVQPNGDVVAKGDEGQRLAFVSLGGGVFEGAPGARATLTTIAGGYRLTTADQVVYEFDAAGKLVSKKDRNGQGVTLAYDGSGRLVTVTDSASNVATFSYTAANLVSGVVLSDGRSVGYGYTAGLLTSFTDVRGKSWTYTYDGAGRLATIVDPLSHTQVSNVYDGTSGRVTSQTDALNKTTVFAWDATTETATTTDPNGQVWKDVYVSGVLVKRIDGTTNETVFGHDFDLNGTTVQGPTGETTEMTYDAAGNMLSATAPASLGSAQKTFTYNANNDPLTVTDARGTVTSYAYDGAGNQTSVSQAGVTVATMTYDAAGRVLTSTNGNGKTTTYTYDAAGNTASQTDPLGNMTTFTYDAAGRVLTRVDPKGNVSGCNCAALFTTSFTYNAAGQVLTETDQLGNTTTSTYDDAGNLLTRTDGNGKVTTYVYDAANRVVSVTAPDGGVSLTSYDDAGNKLTETDPLGHVTTHTYDGANRLVSTTTASGAKTTMFYDANGNLVKQVEPRGNVVGANPDDYATTFTYDAAGRVLTETDPLNHVTTHVYDAVGNESAR